MARRITRKQLKQSDEFVSTMDSIMQGLSEYWKPIAAGLAGICVAAFAWWMFGLWNNSRSNDASYALHHAVTVYEGDDSLGQLIPTGDLDAAEAELLGVIEHYRKTDQADMARVYLARIYFDRNEIDQARDLLVGLAERNRGNTIGRIATLDLIHLRIAAGQAPEVAVELEAMISGSNTGLPRDVALYELGQLYMAEQNPTQAGDYFQKLVDEFPESPYGNLARQRLMEIG
jgi:predicted negative regulator of RcsB-dependent stress response